MGVIIWGLFNPVTQVIPQGLSNHPCLLASMSSCSGCQFWFLCWFWFLLSLMEGMKPPLYRWWGSPLTTCRGVGLFCVREVDACLSLLLTWRGTYPFHSTSLFGLANHGPAQWVAVSILGFTICLCQWALTSLPPLHICVPSDVHCHITLSKVFTHPRWMLWQMSTVKAITSSWSTPGKSCW